MDDCSVVDCVPVCHAPGGFARAPRVHCRAAPADPWLELLRKPDMEEGKSATDVSDEEVVDLVGQYFMDAEFQGGPCGTKALMHAWLGVDEGVLQLSWMILCKNTAWRLQI